LKLNPRSEESEKPGLRMTLAESEGFQEPRVRRRSNSSLSMMTLPFVSKTPNPPPLSQTSVPTSVLKSLQSSPLLGLVPLSPQSNQIKSENENASKKEKEREKDEDDDKSDSSPGSRLRSTTLNLK